MISFLCFDQLEEGIALVREVGDETCQSDQASREALDLASEGRDSHVKYGLYFFWIGFNASFTDHEA